MKNATERNDVRVTKKVNKFIAILSGILTTIFCLTLSAAYGWQTDNGGASLRALENDISLILGESFSSNLITTHPFLTYRIIEQFTKETGIVLPDSVKKQIIYGSIEEDYDALDTAISACYSHIAPDDVLLSNGSFTDGGKLAFHRSFNHFIGNNQSPLSGLTAVLGNLEQLFCDSQHTVLINNLADWAVYSSLNSMNLKRIVTGCDGSVPCDTQNNFPFWKTVGHVLHLIEDASSPAHVRNDPHAIDDSYEGIMGKKSFVAHNSYIPPLQNNQGPSRSGGVQTDVSSIINTLATYTRTNYFSNDTIADPDYPVAHHTVAGDKHFIYNDPGDNSPSRKILYKGLVYRAVVMSSTVNWVLSQSDEDFGIAYMTINNEDVVTDGFKDLATHAIRSGTAVLRILYETYIKSVDPLDTDSDGDGLTPNQGDCNDRDPNIQGLSSWYADNDGDDYGNPSVSVAACGQLNGFVSNNEDCNDNDPTIKDGCSIDADSDGVIDQDDKCLGTLAEAIVNADGCSQSQLQNVTSPLNDTGITWGGNYPTGNNTTCTSNIAGAQDCSMGRDATHNYDFDGHAGFSFTKLDVNGNVLPASAPNWSCVRDNVTGLTWEVKTDDGGIHDKDNTYRWGGKTALGSGYGSSYSDWDSLVDWSNSEGFCGYSDWRVPTRQELYSLVDFGRISPSIDTDYFPNTPALDFWSASPASRDLIYAWRVNFHSGYSLNQYFIQYYPVRLVRSGQ